MLLISFTFISIGLICASNMHDIHGFTMVMNFLVFPSSSSPVPSSGGEPPAWVRVFSYLDPLTYGVDGSGHPRRFSYLPLAVDLAVLSLFSLIFIVLGACSLSGASANEGHFRRWQC